MMANAGSTRSEAPRSAPRLFLSAGEASGEHYGTQLIHALRGLAPGATFFGLGGQRMEAAGLERVVRAEDVAVMGITEVLRHMPRIYGEYRRLKRSLRSAPKPDAAVLIDFPDVNLALARELHRLEIPVIFFVSPQLWAWKKHRIRQVQRYVDRMLVIFPFEEKFYAGHNVAAIFVGHPLADLPPPEISRAEFAERHALDAEKPWVALLPGSREKEIDLNLPTMLQAASQLGEDVEFLLPVAPMLGAAQRSKIAAMIASTMASEGGSARPRVTLVADARAALFHARASVVASGTATVEAALIGNPFLVVYRISELSYAVAKRVVKVPFVAMPNLIADAEVVPELIQGDFTAANVVLHLRRLMHNDSDRETMKENLRRVSSSLRIGALQIGAVESGDAASPDSTRDSDPTTAIDRVARITIELISRGDRHSTNIPLPAREQGRMNRIHARSSLVQHRAAGFLFAPPILSLLALFLLAAPLARAQSQRPTLRVTGYDIDAQIDPDAHSLKATAKVSFTALQTIDTAIFQLHGALKVDKVTDAANNVLSGERGTDGTIRLALPVPMAKGQSATFTFDYGGALTGEGGPVEGLKLASIGSPISYLLYPARWFPMTGYLTDRFTADIRLTVPLGYRAVGSGAVTPLGQSGGTFEFKWDKPGFPGTIIAGKFNPPLAAPSASYVHIWTTDARKANAADFADTAAKQFNFFTGIFGPAESVHFNVVELPDDTLPAFWAPEIAAIPGNRMTKASYRLLANTVARQWWSSQVSPATLNDAWITNGMSRYGELMYLEDEAGRSALQRAILDISAAALAYDTIPLSGIGRDDVFSPDFQSMTLEKGAMVFHMLRWEVGDDSFGNILKAVLTQYADKPIRTSDFIRIAESQSQQQLTPFFAQWIDGTGAPAFNNKYTVYRLGNNKGFRTIGEIGQDLDLFRMPVELKIETDGKTETKRIDVVGTDSQYVVDTFGRPRHISLDPDGWLLKNTPDMQVRMAILRGQQLIAQGDTTGAIDEYQKALAANPNSSLASYRIGEALFSLRNYQASANAYRDALRGDGDPKWTEVWSHIQLGKIFDVTGQRDRAVNEYREAVQTNDNTQGALNEARQHLQAPYKREESND